MHFSIVRIIQLLVIAATTVAGVDFEQCNETNFGKLIESPIDCRHFIYCEEENSFEGECENGYFLDSVHQICEVESMVNCPTQTTATISPTNRPINDLDGTTSSPITGINNSTTAMPSAANTTMMNNITTTQPTGSTSVLTVLVVKECPSVDKPNEMVLLTNARSCSEYYLCYKNEAIEMHCATSLHFNANTGKCDYPVHAKCNLSTVPAKEQCTSHTVGYFPHPSNCNYYYYCHNGFLMLQQCGTTLSWNFEKRQCVKSNEAKCFKAE